MKKILFLLVLLPLFFGCEKDKDVYPADINNTVWESRTYAVDQIEGVAKLTFLSGGVFKLVLYANQGGINLEMGVENNLFYTYENGIVKTSGHFDFYRNGYFLNLKTNEYIYVSDMSDSEKRQLPSLKSMALNVITTLKMQGSDKLVSDDGTVFYRK